MKDFVDAYIEAALWSSSDPDTGESLDSNFGVEDLDPETRAQMESDCEQFCLIAGRHIAADDATRAGHDFWLTRNGHGSGFWDGDWGEELGDTLTELCKGFSDVTLYVTDSGEVSAL